MKHKGFLSTLVAGTLLVSLLSNGVLAEDYSDESYWLDKCTKVQSDQAGVNACKGFLDYQKIKKNELKEQIELFNSSIDSIKDDTALMEQLAREQIELSENLNSQIGEIQDTIDELETNIEDANAEIERIEHQIDEKQEQIDQKQKDIDVWDDQIKARMKNEQIHSGTNVYIDLVMGSDSLADMLSRISGLERITQSDQDQIYDLNKLKESLQRDIDSLEKDKEEQEFMRNDLKRLKNDQQEQKDLLEEQKQQAEELARSYEKIIEEYQKQQAELEAALREAQQDMNQLREFVISTGLSSSIDFADIATASGWISPIASYRKSAGTWAYNSGGLHLGLDMAAPIGTEVRAPISGLVIYTSNTQPTNGGYLGNYSGAPAGSGNCIEMLGVVNGTLYAIAFFHLSNTFYVAPGSEVTQGQVIALAGNAGNSTGPHTHVEIYNLGNQSMSEAVSYFQKTGDWAFKTGWNTTSTACEYKSAPCRERPEYFF